MTVDLCAAAAEGNVELLRALVAHQPGFDLNKGDYDKRTALHLAASEGQLQIVKILFEELGADVSPVDRWNGTPLDDAIRSHHAPVAAYLRAKRGKEGGGGVIVPSAGTSTPLLELWVLPEAMGKALSGELFGGELLIDPAACALAEAALDTWDHDVFALHQASGGHALLLVGMALLERHDLFSSCHLDRKTVQRLLLVMEAGYGDNAYHNSCHGADVALSVHRFLVEYQLLARLTKLDILAALVAAMAHDFNHPGTSNAHEVRVGTKRAHRHADLSVLERHHLHSLFELLQQPRLDIFARLSPDERKAVRSLVVELVLSTDLTRHVESVTQLRMLASRRGFALTGAHGDSWRSPFLDSEEVAVDTLLSTIIKFSDLGHVTKTRAQHIEWTERVTQEFWALGDHERSLGMPISPLCDRHKDKNIGKLQSGFFRFICLPFFSIVADLVDPQMQPWLNCQENLRYWESSTK